MSKSPQSASPGPSPGRPMMALSANIAKALSSSDEFKHGFPSGGLSTASNRWWGSGSSGSGTDQITDGMGRGTGSEQLTTARKNVAEEGRRGTAKFGVSDRNGSERERALLRRVFGSSLPPGWLDPGCGVE